MFHIILIYWQVTSSKSNKFEENTQHLSVLYTVVVRGIYASMYGGVTEREKSDFSSIFNQNIEFMPTTLPPPRQGFRDNATGVFLGGIASSRNSRSAEEITSM